MLTLDGLRLTRGDFTLTADCTVPAQGITALIGPSGGGKSTLLSLIAGFADPDAGRILWGDLLLTPLPPGKRPVATLFQDNNLFPHLDVLTNVCLGLAPGGRPSGLQKARAMDALARVGLTGFETRKPGALSGGQQSRAALARILLTERPIVLMDEPFAALGPALKAEMLDLVAELLAKATVLMVTHDPSDARRIAGTTMLVDDGAVSAPVETSALLDDPPPGLAEYLVTKGR